MKKIISWRRVSTMKQNSTGLGLLAQTEIIEHLVKAEKDELIAYYHEVNT